MPIQLTGRFRSHGLWLTVALLWSAVWLAWQAWLLYRNIIDPLVPVLSAQSWWQRQGSFRVVASPLLAFLLPALGLYGLFAWVNARAFLCLLLPRLRQPREMLLAFLAQLLLATLTMSLLSAWLYPASVMGNTLSLLLVRRSGQWLALGLGITAAAYFLLWLAMELSRLPRLAKWSAGSLLLAIPLAVTLPAASGRHPAGTAQPNIILIGVDSLRPDHLPSFGAPFNVAPHIETFVRGGAVFSDALTTQAHTFPATISILTGLYPTSSGARGNLFPPSLIKTEHSIAWRFQSAGWRTVFGTDETRFANIDGLYGFERVTGPGIGITDYLMSFVSDTVLVNLVANTVAGRWLFPHLYGNRAVADIYRPGSFSRRLELTLDDDDSRPLFLYVHFCSGHWPYESSSLFHEDGFEQMRTGPWADTDTSYLRAIAAADTQVGRLLEGLKRRGRLDNAIVVMFSDHGEDFGMQKDVIRNDAGEPLHSGLNGHGSSAVRIPQVRVLLAWQRYGNVRFTPRSTSLPVSLVDIAPTLADLATLTSPSAVHYDGISLAPALAGDTQTHMEGRTRFVESSTTFGALDTPAIDVGGVIAEAGSNFWLKPNGRVEVLPEYIGPQIARRERSAWSDQQVVMLPADQGAEPLLLDRKRLHWQPIAAAAGAAAPLMAELCRHWEADAVTRPRCAAWREAGKAPGAPPQSGE